MSQSAIKHSEKKIHERSGAKQFTSCKFPGAAQPGAALYHRAVRQRKPVWDQSHFSRTYWLSSNIRWKRFRSVAVQLFLQGADVAKACKIPIPKAAQRLRSAMMIRCLPVSKANLQQLRPFSNSSLQQLLHLQMAPVLYNFPEVSSCSHLSHHPIAET